MHAKLAPMNEQAARLRVAALLAGHVLVGGVCGGVSFFWSGWGWHILVELTYLALIISQALILGSWIGLGPQRWYVSLIGGMAGALWLFAIAFAPFPYKTVGEALQLCGMLLPIPFVVALVAAGFRWLVIAQRADAWPVQPVSKELQFTLGSLIGLMVLVSVLLGLGGVLRSMNTDEAPVFVGIACFLAVLVIGLLIWACLGVGRPAVRVPIAISAMVAIGLLFPYYTRDTYLWRYAVWAGLMFAIGLIMSSSLLVVRSCGYRLIVRRTAIPTAGETLNQATGCEKFA